MATDISVTINPAPTIAATIGEGISPHAFTHAPGSSDSVAQWYATSGDLISVSGQIPITTGFVSVTGNQTVSGVKNFVSRPTVNGTGVLLSGEADNTGFITGYVQKSETGNFVTNSQTGSLTGSFYPLGTNPSGYIVGAVVRPSNTGIFVDLGGSQTISGQKTFTKALVSPSLLIGTGSFSSGAYNSSIGTGNQIFGQYNASLGNDNKIGQSVATTDLSQDNVIVGISNIIDGEQVSDNILIGKANALNKAEVSSLTQPNYFDNTLVGFENSINHTTDDPIISHTNNAIFGLGNTLYGGGSNVVVGINNYSLSEYIDSLIFGQGNEIFGNQSMGIGFGAITSGQETIVIRGPQGLFLEGPLTFNQRPTLDGVGFLLSGEASGVSTTGILITGTSTKTIILYQSDGSTVSGSFTDQQGSGSGSDFYIYSGSFNTGNGQLTLNRTGDAGSVVIPLDGRYVTGQVVRANETGSFATTGFVSGVSGYLQGQVNSLTGQTGNYALSSQTGAFLTTGAADSRYVAQSATGAYTGVFYPRNSNPSGYLVSGDLNSYATTSSLTGVSGHLQGQINVLTGQTGTYVTGLVVRPSETGAFLTTGVGDSRYVNVTGDTVNGNLEVTGYTSGQSFALKNGGYIDFQSGAPSWKEGRVFYDTDSHSLSYYNEQSDMTLNIGQEQVVRVSNAWTGTILNGSVVIISGAQGNRPAILPASATFVNPTGINVLGVATHDIVSQGYVTVQGLVNGLNTTGFSEGDLLFLSETSGQYTKTAPLPPAHRIRVGTVTRSHATQGAILVHIDEGTNIALAHDAVIINPQQGDILRYVSGSGVWKNEALNTGSFITSSQTGQFVPSGSTGAFLTTGDGDVRYLRIPSVREIYIDAGAMLTGISGATPTTTSVGSISYDGYAFDPSTTGFAQFKISLGDYNLNNIKLKFNWVASSTGSVVWGVQSASVGDGDSLSFSWGNPQEVTDSFITGTGIHQSVATSGFVPTGAPQSGDTLFFRIYRNTFSASDTISTSATLLGVSIQYTGNLITAW